MCFVIYLTPSHQTSVLCPYYNLTQCNHYGYNSEAEKHMCDEVEMWPVK